MQRLLHLHHGGCTMTFATSASVVGFLKAGTLRPLAVTTIKRFSLMPDLPTVAELGLPGFDATDRGCCGWITERYGTGQTWNRIHRQKPGSPKRCRVRKSPRDLASLRSIAQ
jgi:hypothetical protein